MSKHPIQAAKWQTFSAWLSLLALLIALLGLLHAENLKHTIENRFSQLKQELLTHIKHQRDEIQASLDQQANPKARNRLEVQLLMQEAKFYWEFTQDAASTTRFFDLAIDKLAQEADAETQALRQRLLTDRQLLQQVKTPSHQALINQLEQLSHQVLLSAQSTSLSTTTSTTTSTTASKSSSFWHHVINVRTINANHADIDQVDRQQLQQELLLKLSAAKTAVIQQNTVNYQNDLMTALNLWKKIAPNTSEAQAISNSLEQLSRISLRTNLPIKSWSSTP